MRMTTCLTAAGLAAAMLAGAGHAHAAISNTTSVNSTTAIVFDNTFGTVELALNVGDGGAVVRDGISFANAGATDSTAPSSVVYGSAGGISVGGTSPTTMGTANIGSDSLYHTLSYSTANADLAVTVAGLNPLLRYQIQIAHGDPRGPYIYADDEDLVTIQDSTNDSTTLDVEFGDTNSPFALSTFEVFGATVVTYNMIASPDAGPSVSAIVVSSIPEPASLALLGLGGLLLMRRRRA